ncbi:MAG: hypothetical protein WCP07_02765 [bacterium]
MTDTIPTYLNRDSPLVLTQDFDRQDFDGVDRRSTIITGGNAALESPLILVGRSEGKRLLPVLIAAMEAMPPRSILPVDCGLVRIMDVSFGDESLVRLARRRAAREFPERFFVLENVGEELEANLKTLLEIREIFVPVWLSGSAQASVVSQTESPILLGDVGPEMRETYQVARRLGKLTARELIEQLPAARLSIAAASNRLTRLAEAGALAALDSESVEGGGRQKVFAPVW